MINNINRISRNEDVSNFNKNTYNWIDLNQEGEIL